FFFFLFIFDDVFFPVGLLLGERYFLFNFSFIKNNLKQGFCGVWFFKKMVGVIKNGRPKILKTQGFLKRFK
ncbi:hypothetical protein ACVGV4_00415, partial [Enterobacter hormaechei]